MNTLTMARRKKEVTPNRQLAQAILDQYHPKSVEDMQEALKDIFGPMFEVLWSSIFVTLVAKKYHESVTLPSGLRMVYDNH